MMQWYDDTAAKEVYNEMSNQNGMDAGKLGVFILFIIVLLVMICIHPLTKKPHPIINKCNPNHSRIQKQKKEIEFLQNEINKETGYK